MEMSFDQDFYHKLAILRAFWKSGANLTSDLSIFGHEPICVQKNTGKSKCIFHWKFRGDRACILRYLDRAIDKFFGKNTFLSFGLLQEVNWAKSLLENANFEDFLQS